MNFQVQQIPRVRQLHKIGEVGKWNYISMTYSLSNNSTKKYYNRMLTVQVIVEDVVTWIFLRHSVYIYIENTCREYLSQMIRTAIYYDKQIFQEFFNFSILHVSC